MPTIIDIAKKAGVSFKTVSRVLNEEVNVRPATRQKVLDAAKFLNYRTNTAARNLRSKRPKVIALLINNPSQSYTQSVQLGALLGCQKYGLFLSLHTKYDKKTIASLASNAETIGFILTPPISDNKKVLETLSNFRKPFVRLGTEHPKADGTSICINDRQASYKITEYLISLGHKHIGFIKGHVDYETATHRLLGYQEALEANGLLTNNDHIVQGDFSYAGKGSSSQEPTNLEGSSVFGDSGGPMYANLEGVWLVVAVTAHGGEYSDYGDVAFNSRVSVYYDWICSHSDSGARITNC